MCILVSEAINLTFNEPDESSLSEKMDKLEFKCETDGKNGKTKTDGEKGTSITGNLI